MPSAELAVALSQLISSGTTDVLINAFRAGTARRLEVRAQGTDVDGFNDPLRDPARLLRLLANARVHGTASSLVVPPTPVSETTVDALIATQDAYGVRQGAVNRQNEAVHDHQSKYLDEWQLRVKGFSEKPATALLDSLWNSGFSWRDIARLLKVSVPAIQKWRSGDKISVKNFARLRDFIAAYDTVAANKPEIDVAGWLDVPLRSDVPITPQQLWTEGNPSLFFEYSLGEMSSEDALGLFDPDWRRKYLDDGFETFVGADGLLSIRTKNR